jgi:membrane associated rhomboid family serine protease
MAICIIIFLAMQFMEDSLLRQITYVYGMVPIRYAYPEWAARTGLPPDQYLSFLTSLFIHSGWLHIIINMWFLWIFADNIEDRMGHFRFLIFYLLCGLIATFVQWYDNPKLMLPVVGASGAIAAVLGAYFVLYPFARIIIWVPLFFLPLFFEVPAIAFLGFWVIMQLQQVTASFLFEGVATVAWWAHLSGFVAGALLHRLFLTERNVD